MALVEFCISSTMLYFMAIGVAFLIYCDLHIDNEVKYDTSK